FSIVALVYGEVAPLVVFAIAAAMWALRSAKWGAACAAYALIAVLPQIALPVWLATMLYSKPMRLRLLFLGAALVLLDLLAGGPGFMRRCDRAVHSFQRHFAGHTARACGGLRGRTARSNGAEFCRRLNRSAVAGNPR